MLGAETMIAGGQLIIDDIKYCQQKSEPIMGLIKSFFKLKIKYYKLDTIIIK